MKGIVSAAVVSLAIAASPVFAQTPTPRVDKREAKQQGHVAVQKKRRRLVRLRITAKAVYPGQADKHDGKCCDTIFFHRVPL